MADLGIYRDSDSIIGSITTGTLITIPKKDIGITDSVVCSSYIFNPINFLHFGQLIMFAS